MWQTGANTINHDHAMNYFFRHAGFLLHLDEEEDVELLQLVARHLGGLRHLVSLRRNPGILQKVFYSGNNNKELGHKFHIIVLYLVLLLLLLLLLM